MATQVKPTLVFNGKVDKVTPNTKRFAYPNPRDPSRNDTIYIPKEALHTLGDPEEIVITITAK